MDRSTKRKASPATLRRPRSTRAQQSILAGNITPDLAADVFRHLPNFPQIDFEALHPPQPLSGKRIDRKQIESLLSTAQIAEHLASGKRPPVKSTLWAIRRLQSAVSKAGADPRIPSFFQRDVQSFARKSERMIEILEAVNRGTKAGRPGTPLLNWILVKIRDELVRATGRPQWSFLLKLVTKTLPASFPPDGSRARLLGLLRSRIRYGQRN